MTLVPEDQGLVAVVQVGSWRVMMHRSWCGMLSRVYLTPRAISPGMTVRLCGHCKPTEEDVAAYLKQVNLYPYAHAIRGLVAGHLELPEP